MDMIERESPVAFKRLQLMSYLVPAKIPEELIKCALFLENGNAVRFSKALGTLLSFGLLHSLECSNYRLHRLVGFFVFVSRWNWKD
jgi:hypothetical protein